MMTASVSLNNGPLKGLEKQIKDTRNSYLKVGVLGSSVARGRGQVANLRWKGTYKRWSKKGGRYVTSGPKWNSASGSYETNASIGLRHEFGSPDANLPERSFLRMPVITRLDKEISTVPRADWEYQLQTKGLPGLLEVIGQMAFNVIRDAFHTGGFGRWAPLQPATIRRKQSSDILINTTQLERSIAFTVVTKQ